MPLDNDELLTMTPDELDELFRQSLAGEIPDGEADGAVLLASGTELSGHLSTRIHCVAWK